ncbi:MAG: hypothetical protein KatS3mg105_4168 [Gemmatales bacterium]|nr:MAG: hypothetical protein KatS3mg105_4168 [Gemmatales bacterium]
MRFGLIILTLLIGIWMVMGFAFYLGELGSVIKTSDFGDMHAGDEGRIRHEPFLPLGWAVGVLQISIFVCCLSLGVGRKDAPFRRALAAGWLLFAAVFTFLAVSYQWYVERPQANFLGPFPTPTTILLLGMWGAPLYFVALFVLMFDRWILPPESLERAERLLDVLKEEESN